MRLLYTRVQGTTRTVVECICVFRLVGLNLDPVCLLRKTESYNKKTHKSCNFSVLIIFKSRSSDEKVFGIRKRGITDDVISEGLPKTRIRTTRVQYGY